MMIRNCFVREEHQRLVVGSGIRPEWWRETDAAFGPTLTPFGPVSVRVLRSNIPGQSAQAAPGGASVSPRVLVEGAWRGAMPQLELRLPGFAPQQRAATAAREEFSLSAAP